MIFISFPVNQNLVFFRTDNEGRQILNACKSVASKRTYTLNEEKQKKTKERSGGGWGGGGNQCILTVTKHTLKYLYEA